MLFTTKQLLEGSRKVMRIGLNNPDSLGGKEKNKVSLGKTLIELLDKTDGLKDGFIDLDKLSFERRDVLKRALMEGGVKDITDILRGKSKLSIKKLEEVDENKILGKTRENLNALHYELLEQVSGVAQLPKSVNLPKDNPGNPKEAQPELKPEEARKIVEDFKPTRDSENEDKVMALQVALNSLGQNPKLEEDGKFGRLTEMALRTEKEGRYVDDIIKRILSNEETREKAIALLDEKNDIEFARGLEKLGYNVQNNGSYHSPDYNVGEIKRLRGIIRGNVESKSKQTAERLAVPVEGILWDVENVDEALNLRGFDEFVKAHTFNELQTALNDIRDIKDSKNQQTKIKELGYKYGAKLTSDSTETKAFISKLSSVVKTQERVQNLLDKENWKEALSVIVDFNKDQLLSGEENVSFHYKELQVFDGVNREQFGNILANLGYGNTGAEAFTRFKDVFETQSYYTAREELKDRIGIISMVKNVLNLDSMRTDPKALQKFYEKVNKREQRVYNKVDNYTKEKGLSDETKIAMKGLINNYLAKQHNVLSATDEQVDANIDKAIAKIEKDIAKVNITVEEWVKNKRDIPEEVKNDPSFLDAMKNGHVQLMLTNRDYGVGVTWNVAEFTSNLLTTAGLAIVNGTPGIVLAKTFESSDKKMRVTVGTGNFIPFIAGNAVISEGDLSKEFNGDLSSYKRFSANDVSLDASVSSKGSMIGVSVDKLTENTKKGIERAKGEMEKNYKEAVDTIVRGDEVAYMAKLENPEDKKVFEMMSQMLPILGGGNSPEQLKVGAERLSQGMTDRFEIAMYEMASKEGWNISSITVGLAFISGYFAIPFINITAQSHEIKWVKSSANSNIVTNPEPTTEKEKVNPEINLKYYEVTIDKVVEDILKDFESSGVNGNTRKIWEGEVQNIDTGTLNSRWDAIMKTVKREKKYATLRSSLEKIEGMPNADELKKQIIDGITFKLHTSHQFGGAWTPENKKDRFKGEKERRPKYNEIFGFNTDKYYEAIKGQMDGASNISTVSMGTLSVDASSPINLRGGETARKRARGISMQNTQIELISIKGGEPLTEPIDENDTKKFFIELNSKERDYHKGYIEALNNLFGYDPKTKDFVLPSNQKAELYLAKDAGGFDDRLLIKTGKGEIITVPPVPPTDKWDFYRPEASTDEISLLLAAVKEKPKNNKPKNPGDGDAKAETNPDAKSDAGVDNNQAIPDTSKPTLTPTPDDVRPPAPDTVAPDVGGGPKGRS